MKVVSIIFFLLFSAGTIAGMSELEEQAKSGDANAQYLMGYSFEMGQNNPVNLSKAIKWYKEASANNNPRAMHRLGLMYATGSGVPSDFAKTAELFEAAAKQKDPAAQMDYTMLLFGMAPPEYKNSVEAYAWFAVIEANDPTAYASIKDLKPKLEAELSKKQLQHAIDLGAEYIAKYSPNK
ncbi:tetratricopeptide repeat protein [Teredinibacter purpureus]|uniref:tetratricopeptide repeat protein n=1 Tax=Teredinibacter purpureus TaxID=2731756 RepID=UPI000696253D|nr:tetratricopeptide repeat protein [Teredinibacter purpureus]